MKLKAKLQITHQDKVYEPGDTLEINDKDLAKRLVDQGAAEEASDKPAKESKA